ncbi:MAG: hypothetical protein CVU50_02520 [Candidatus Cloacimonetes bacterium HGW-Cloacimonetes-3]|nr:MAG: hypothetical protein CVU50_02520 [Candidatus Cloacimonetes bacterium HGW-Cloacimonetes-3]
MKKQIIFLLYLLPLLNLFAGAVSIDRAENIGRDMFSYLCSSDVTLLEIEPIRNAESQEVDIYVLRFVPQGFLLLAAEDQSSPVLAYSLEADFPTENMPPHVQWYLSQYSRSMTELRNHPEWAVDPEWAALSRREFSSYQISRDVAPLLSTNWDQDWPYNSMCPADASGPGGRVYAGCVATAMGQVMKKWNYPPTGNGTHSYYAAGYGNQSANFGATTYNWASMPNSITSVNTNISTLLYHCGISVDMIYAPDGSGAYSEDVRNSLVNYFRYNTAAQYKTASSYTATNWATMLRGDLDLGRPIYYSGQGSNGGHAFVLDGYQGTNYFHFNWGWSGYYNGYFYLNNLNPGSNTFNQYQAAVLYVYPISTEPLNPPVNAVATDINNNLNVSWQAPGGAAGNWIHYDSGENTDSIGTEGVADFDVAIRYPASALTAYAGMSLYSVKVWPAEAGSYSIRVWTGGSAAAPGTMVVDQPFTPVIGAWNSITLATPVPISGTQELWFGMRCNVQTGYPAGCDAGPAINGFGNMIYWSGTWTNLLALSASLNYNWNIQGYVGNSAPNLTQVLTLRKSKALSPIADVKNRISSGSLSISGNLSQSNTCGSESNRALTGYRVWRLLSSNQDNEATWTSITPSAITATSINDSGWISVPNGTYKWAVKAVYTGGLVSPPAFSNMIVKGSPNGTLAGIVRNAQNQPISGATVTCGAVTATTNTSGAYSLVILAGTYSVTASQASYTSSTQTGVVIIANQTTNLNFVLTTSTNQLQDGFETYSDFALAFAPWTLVDVDLSTTYGFTSLTFPNSGAAMAYIIFNPSATIPALDTPAHAGAKMAACFASTVPPNNDWLITPQVTGATELKFWAKSYTEVYGLERFKVGVSTTGTVPASFTIISGANYIQAPTTWTEYSYDLSAYGNTPIRIGIQCVSFDAFIFFVDDVTIGSGGTPPQDPFGSPTVLPTSMTVVAGVTIGGVQASNGDVLAAYVNVGGTPQLRGKQTVQVVSGIAGCMLQVYTETNGETISFKVWDASANEVISSPTTLASIVNGTVGSVENLFMVDASASVTQSIALTSGWNLVSLNVSPANHSIASLFATMSGNVQQIKGTDGVYIPNNPYSTLTSLTDGKAYNILLTSAANWSVTGTPIAASTPIALLDGWNMVAYLPQSAMPVTTAIQSIATWLLQVKGTDGIYIPDNPYSTLATMSPNKGYWVKINGAHNLVYPASRETCVAHYSPQEASRIGILSDMRVKQLPASMTVLAQCRKAASGDILLARVNGELRGAEVLVAPEGIPAALLQIYTETAGEEIKFSILKPDKSELPIETALSSQPLENIGVYPNLLILEMKIAGDETIPTPTLLIGSYPNPFNPSTTISFSVANDNSPVTLEIYNLKGQKVATLINTSLSKGNHSIVWNGKDDDNHSVASGHYFIKMNCDTYNRNLKVLLAK